MVTSASGKPKVGAPTGKHWRMTYSTLRVNSRYGRVQSWTFLTVAEVFEHARLNDIAKFRLEDIQTRVH